MKNKFKEILCYVSLIAILWFSISTIIQALKCPKMTQTELIGAIPDSFTCRWRDCI